MAFGRPRRTAFRSGSPLNVKESRNPLSLTAAGSRITRRDADNVRRLIQPWQSRAYEYFDRLGEINYASRFYARMLSPLELYPAYVNDDGEIEKTDDANAVALLARIRDPGGGVAGRQGLLGDYGRLQFLAGECYLFNSTEDGQEKWEMLSTDELRVQSGLYLRYRAPSLMAGEYREPSDDDWEPVADDTAVAYRLWQRHPRFSALATSTMAGVLDICEELLLLTLAVRARARSRLAAAGILLIDEAASPAPPEPGPDEDPEEDLLLADIVEAMTTPIVQEGAASSVVPYLLRLPVPDGKKLGDLIEHLQIVDPTQLYPETGLRNECIDRLAIGLDLPPEILRGFAEANHWTGWLVDEQTWKHHGQTLADQLVADISSAFFRPALRDLGVKDWNRYLIAYDAAAIINHPDRTKDAKDLYAARAIGKKALRTASGFDDEDAPTKDELAEMVGIAVRDGSLAWYGEPNVKAGGVEVAPGDIVSPDDPAQPGAATGGEVEAGPPPDDGTDAPSSVVGSSNGNGHGNGYVAARIAGGALLAVYRAREAAGNRIRQKARKDPAVLEEIRDLAGWEVAAKLGPDRVRALGVVEAELVGGATAIVEDALRIYGADKAQAKAIAAQVERFALQTLYQEPPPPMPANFDSFVEGVLSGRR